MKNFVQNGDVLSLTAPYDVAAGAAFKVGGIIAVATSAALSGAAVEGIVVGVFDLAKVSAQGWATIGLPIFWDDSAKLFTTTSSGNTLAGVNVATASNPSVTGRVRLTP